MFLLSAKAGATFKWSARAARWLPPAFLVVSVVLWLTAPNALMNRLTPLAGALALLCAGLYLASVLVRIVRFTQRHHYRLASRAGNQLARLHRSVWIMIAILIATFAMSAAFYFSATRLLTDVAGAGQARLLWMLTLGGLALALGFGRLVIL